MTKEDLDQNELQIDTSELNRNLQNFCGSILIYHQDVLNEKEFIICKLLIKGSTLLGVSKETGLSRERVRQNFFKAIKKIRDSYQSKIDELEAIRKENEELKHRNLILENELLTDQGLGNVNSLLSQEEKLCKNAKRLLNTPANYLPLPPRVLNTLESLNVTKFSEIPLLSQITLLSSKNCGKKTIYDLRAYLKTFSLEFGMTYEDVIKQLAKLQDEDISPDNFKGNAKHFEF